MSDNEGIVCFQKNWSQCGEECGVEVVCPMVGRLSGPELMPKCDLPIMQLNAVSAAQHLQGSLCTA